MPREAHLGPLLHSRTMTLERWQQIGELFHAALACEAPRRAEFLTAHCADDDTLRHEVESLLSAYEDAVDFIETPAGDVAAEMLGAYESTFQPGQQIGNYKIVGKLGSGGMSEVYLAEDTRLNRNVALKMLPLHFTVNLDRVRRFEREARAASALNHPNIVTVYEVGQSNSVHFIVTEFVDGQTLRQLLNETPFRLKETLNVVIQIADALSGTHAAGIVHRDIKPENIMIRRDGWVKILDFGLAKLSEQCTANLDLETPTLLQSNPGLVMGTVQYMSPEQARGKNVDARTDVWSLGVVLYELLAGQAPFAGETPSHVMVALMETEPPPLRTRARIPDELDRIVRKALRKNQEARYKSAGHFSRDLKSLRERLQLDPQLSAWLKTVPSQERSVSDEPQVDTRQPAQLNASAESTIIGQTERPTVSPEFPAQVSRRKVTTFATLLVLAVVGIAFSYVIWDRAPSASSVVSQPALSVSQSGKRGTTNDEAYRSYLQGKNLMNQRNQADAEKAIYNFHEAIRIDPNFAQPYAGLGIAYVSLGIWGDARTENPKANSAIKKALELDHNLADAYSARALMNVAYQWDLTAAEKDALRVLELDQNNDTAYWLYAMVLAYTGRFEQSLKAIETAQAIAPGTPVYERDRGRILFYTRRYEDAISQLKRAIELKQDFPSAWAWIIRTCEMKGDQAGAYDWFIRWHEFKREKRTEEYRKAYARAGWTGVRRKLVEFVKLEQNRSAMHRYELAGHLALLGETAEAFSYLNESVDRREWEVAMLNIDPFLDGIRGDPRFTELAKRANLR